MTGRSILLDSPILDSARIFEIMALTIDGTSADETLEGRSADDTIHGGGGKDWLFGRDGSDHLNGGFGEDYLYGGEGPDYLWGGPGADADKLFGEGGDDLLGGEDGNDLLMGGLGADQLIGGAGQDTFYYNDAIQESPAYSWLGDRILDFHYDGENDKIDLPIAGTAQNYFQARTGATSIDEAFLEANQTYEAYMQGTGLTYLYLYNETQDTGYLIADMNGNGNVETGIALVGAGMLGEFGYDAII